MDFIVSVWFFVVCIGVWRWLALRMGRKGRGWFVRHFMGSTLGFFAGFLFFGFAVAIGLISPEKKEAEPDVLISKTSEPVIEPEVKQVEAPVKQIKTLGFTPDEYAKRLNKAFKSVDMSYRISAKEIVKGEVNDVLKVSIGKHAALVVSISKVNGQVLDAVVIGAGDGSPSSGLDIMMVASAALTAAAPDVEFHEVFRGLPALIKGQERTYGNVKISAKKMDAMGTWFFAAPVGDGDTVSNNGRLHNRDEGAALNTHYVESDEYTGSFKRTVEVKLADKLTHEQLKAVAEKIKAGEKRKTERTFIGYRLEQQQSPGYWATTHYNPDLEVRILDD